MSTARRVFAPFRLCLASISFMCAVHTFAFERMCSPVCAHEYTRTICRATVLQHLAFWLFPTLCDPSLIPSFFLCIGPSPEIRRLPTPRYASLHWTSGGALKQNEIVQEPALKDNDYERSGRETGKRRRRRGEI